MSTATPFDLSLDAVVEEVQQTLRRLGICDRGLDGRVAPVPDARTVRYYTTLGLVDRPRIVDREARYGQRHVLKPGLTGWAQIRYTYGASVEDAIEKLQYDLYYIKNLSIALDFVIVLETIKTVITRKGAR